MKKKKPYQEQSASQPDTTPSSTKTDNKWECITAACRGQWEFFWNSPTGQKIVLISMLAALLSGAYYLGTWRDTLFWQIKLERQASENERDQAKLENVIAEQKHKLDQIRNESEPSLETAEFAGCSYEEFVRDLEKARSQDAIAVSTVTDQYCGKKVMWDCTILEMDPTYKYYVVGMNAKTDPRNRAHAEFRSNAFDRFVKVGENKKIEGIFRSADESGIILYDCRFVPESK